MNKTRMVVSLCSLALAGPAQAAPVVSHFPQQGLGQFLAERFDLTSIRSSFGPRRTMHQRSFADFHLKPTRATNTLVEFAHPDWFYRMVVTERRDINSDGVEDLAVCFTDKAMNGDSYDTQKSLLVTRLSPDAHAIALSFATNACDATADHAPGSKPGVAEQSASVPYYEAIGRFIYGYHRAGISLTQLNDPELARRGPPELATRARSMAQKFDWILNGEIKPPEAELQEILREAVAISAEIRSWQQGSTK